MQGGNYQKQLDAILENLGRPGKLLLHSCCAPCSSYCLEYLSSYFEITVLYYNPNITDREEYDKRIAEQKRLIEAFNTEYANTCQAGVVRRVGNGRTLAEGSGCFGEGISCIQEAGNGSALAEEAELSSGGGVLCKHYEISFCEGDYDPETYLELVKGLEHCPEGGDRCRKCFELRLSYAAKLAAEGNYDYFTTTFTISPLKNADMLNEIGREMGAKYGIEFLPSDFKKRNGYKRSIELSKEYGLYRQDYCGCAFSKAAREQHVTADRS